MKTLQILSLRLPLFWSLMIWCALGSSNGFSDIRPERIHVAETKKTKSYIRDGLIVGGDKTIDDVIVKDIRWSSNGGNTGSAGHLGFDRIVIDLVGNHQGENVAIQRPPYYQIAVTPDERRLLFTLWGKPRLDFKAKKILEGFKKSSVIQSISLFPHLEDNLWMFGLELKSDTPVEVFELTHPVRIIIDIQHKKI